MRRGYLIARDSIRFHVTVLSNLARAYDRYARVYDKAKIPESTYPGEFYLLQREHLGIGLEKAEKLAVRTGLEGDCPVVLGVRVDPGRLRTNTRNGRGEILDSARVEVACVMLPASNGECQAVSVEEAMAKAYRVMSPKLLAWSDLKPRSFSILPVAKGCQADCQFCFSRASISSDQSQGGLTLAQVEHALAEAKARGAERAVITGGGEPGLLPFARLLGMIEACHRALGRVTLITNGYSLGSLPAAECAERLSALHHAGLRTLSVSRHHWDATRSAALMKLDCKHDALAKIIRSCISPRLRWVCVLQRGGVEDDASLISYLDMAAASGAVEICFKELYVSASTESVYHDRDANAWSERNQIPLALLLRFAERHGWVQVGTLPWGAPLYDAPWGGTSLRIAAYTEPSVMWERTQGLCRSWNLMADGNCYASLEDRASLVLGASR